MVRADRRQAGGGRLDDHRRQPFGVAVFGGDAGRGEQPGAPHPAGDLGRRQGAEEADRSTQPERRAVALEGAPQGSVADDRQRRRRRRLPRRGEGADQQGRPLLLDQPADMEDQARLRLRAARPQAIEVDADMMGDGAGRGKAARDRLAPKRIGDGEEKPPRRHQPPLEQCIAGPGQLPRQEHPRTRAVDVVAVQRRHQRHAERARERQRDQAVGGEMDVEQGRRPAPDAFRQRPGAAQQPERNALLAAERQQDAAGELGRDMAFVLEPGDQRLVAPEANRLRLDEGLGRVEQRRAEDGRDRPAVRGERIARHRSLVQRLLGHKSTLF